MKAIIDHHLESLRESGLNRLPSEIPVLMRTDTYDQNEEWNSWKPIPSLATDEEVLEFESRLKYKLPESYIELIKYKHFLEFQIDECELFGLPVGTWRASLSSAIWDGYPNEFLIDRGLMPFANWSDWGHLCFNFNEVDSVGEPSITLWDNQDAYGGETEFINFRTMLQELHKRTLTSKV